MSRTKNRWCLARSAVVATISTVLGGPEGKRERVVGGGGQRRRSLGGGPIIGGGERLQRQDGRGVRRAALHLPYLQVRGGAGVEADWCVTVYPVIDMIGLGRLFVHAFKCRRVVSSWGFRRCFRGRCRLLFFYLFEISALV